MNRYVRDIPRRNRALWRDRNPRARPPIPLSTRTVIRKRRPSAVVAAEKASRDLTFMRSIRTVPFGDKEASEEIKRRSSKTSMVVNPELVQAGQRELRIQSLSKLVQDRTRRKDWVDDRPGAESRMQGPAPSESIASLTPSRGYRLRGGPVRPKSSQLTFTRAPSPALPPQARRRPLVSSETQVGRSTTHEEQDSRPPTTTTHSHTDSRTTESTDIPTSYLHAGASASQGADAYQPQPAGEAERLGVNLPLQRTVRVRAQFRDQHRREIQERLDGMQRQMAEELGLEQQQILEQHGRLPRTQQQERQRSIATGIATTASQQRTHEGQQQTEEALGGVLDRMAIADGANHEGGLGSAWDGYQPSVADPSTTRTRLPGKAFAVGSRQFSPNDENKASIIPLRENSWAAELNGLLDERLLTASQAEEFLLTVKYGSDDIEAARPDHSLSHQLDDMCGKNGISSNRSARSGPEAFRVIPEAPPSHQAGGGRENQTQPRPSPNGPPVSPRMRQSAPGTSEPHRSAGSTQLLSTEAERRPAEPNPETHARTAPPPSSWAGVPQLDDASFDNSPGPSRPLLGAGTRKTAQSAPAPTNKARALLKDGMSGIQMTEYLQGVLNNVPAVKTVRQLRNEQRKRRIGEKRRKNEKDQLMRNLTEYRGFEERRLRAEQLEMVAREGSDSDEYGKPESSRTRAQKLGQGSDPFGADKAEAKGSGGRRGLASQGGAASCGGAHDYHLSPTQLNTLSSPPYGRSRTWNRKRFTATIGRENTEQQWADTQESKNVLMLRELLDP